MPFELLGKYRMNFHALRSILLISICLSASAADALVTYTVRATNQNGTLLVRGDVLVPGDRLQLDVTTTNDGSPVFGIGAAASSYSPDLAFFSGATTAEVLSVICIPGTGCFGGLTNTGSTTFLEEIDHSAGVRVQFINAVSTTGTTQTGEIDVGVSGVPGDPQSQLFFDVLSPTVFDHQNTVHVGSLADFGNAVLTTGGASDDWQTVWVVPEPSTALLFTLGLVGLSRTRRSQIRTETWS